MSDTETQAMCMGAFDRYRNDQRENITFNRNKRPLRSWEREKKRWIIFLSLGKMLRRKKKYFFVFFFYYYFFLLLRYCFTIVCMLFIVIHMQ